MEANTLWKPSIVKTMLSRLVDKGSLSLKQGGRAQVYAPVVTRDSCAREETIDLLRRFFGGSTKKLVSSFIEAGELTEAELVELRSLLDEKSPL